MTYRSKVATVFLLGFFLDLINMFIASVAFPAMGRTLHASVGELAWVSNGYIAGLTLVLLFSARSASSLVPGGYSCFRSAYLALGLWPQEWPTR